MKRYAVDLFCGLGGWTEGFLSEGFEVLGFDIERHVYGEHRYPAQLVLQDVRTLHGSRLEDAAVIVASPPCQFFSYTAMPWSRAKKLAEEVRSDPERLEKELELFKACFRIAEEAGVPLIVENVCGAQKWVGPAKWHYGSFYLWGDVPALMPMMPGKRKIPGFRFDGSGRSFQTAAVGLKNTGGSLFNMSADRNLRDGIKVGDAGWRERGPGRQLQDRAIKNNGGSWFNVAHNPDGRKCGGDWFGRGNSSPQRMESSKSSARKAASAKIAKIPFPLARHVARCFKFDGTRVTA